MRKNVISYALPLQRIRNTTLDLKQINGIFIALDFELNEADK
jgi:hypothetical protein